jgi:DNA polymerase III alpha subunit
MKSVLNNRDLWYDGTIEIHPKDVLKWVMYSKLSVTEMTDDIVKFNKNVLADQKIKLKNELDIFDLEWNIPSKYNTMNIKQYITDKLVQVGVDDGLTEVEFVERHKRVQFEFNVFNQLELVPLLKTLVYIIDNFIEKQVVWGVGRGSSVSSYILYLLGVHDIDSVTYELDFNEFLRN